MTTMPLPIAERAGDEPAHTVARGRQQELEPAGRLVGRPAADERGRGQPDQDQPELDEHELQEAADGADVDAREDVAEESLEVRRRRRAARRTSVRSPRSAGRTGRARCPTPAPSAGSRRAVRPVGPRRPARARGRPGQGIALVAPEVAAHERLDADRAQDDHDDRDEDQRRPVELAGQRQVVGGPAEPGEVGEWREARDGGLVAVEEEPAERDRAGDAGRGATAEERGQRERDGPGGQRQEAEPDRVAGGGVRRESRRPAASRRRRRRSRSRRRSTAIAMHERRHVAEQLLERDPPPGHRRRPRRTRGCRGAPRRRACRTGRGSTTG